MSEVIHYAHCYNTEAKHSIVQSFKMCFNAELLLSVIIIIFLRLFGALLLKQTNKPI